MCEKHCFWALRLFSRVYLSVISFYFGVFTPFPIINESLKKRRDCVHFTIGAS